MKKLLCLFFMLSNSAFAFESFQIGPSLKVIDVPHPAQVGLEGRFFNKYLGVSVHKGFLPELAIDQYDVKIDNIDIGLKYHPFKGSFYIGALIGNQQVSVRGQEEIQGQQVGFDVKVKSQYITPHIGWQWQFNSGFFMGMHLGWQISSGASTSLAVSGVDPIIEADPEYQDAKNNIQKEGNNIGNQSLPSVGLLNVGWLL